jgi:hypothetical protein
MRKLSMIACAVLAAPAVLSLACGGGTPAPKDESEAASNSGSGAGDNAPASSSSATPSSDDSSSSSPSAPGASSAAEGGPAPAATTDASGDIKPTNGDDPWLAGHQMPPKDVMKTMRARNGKVHGCWKAGLKRDPSTSGEVKIRFVITNDGAVRAWRDDGSSMSDADVTQCVGEVLNKAKFPKQKSPGDAWGVYSINFSP